MGRILSIDYGRKRTGLAVTDPLQIIANGLSTIPTHELEKWLMSYRTCLGWLATPYERRDERVVAIH